MARVTLAVGLVAGVLAATGDHGADAERRVTTRAFIAVMCKFADNANGYNFTSADIDTMFNGSPYGLDGLVREMSLGEANLAGSKAVGWFTLPKARANYAPDWDGAAELTRDCAASAVAGGVDIAPFRNIMVFLNDQLPGAEGRTVPVSIPVNGQPTDFTSVLITRRGLNSPGLVLHELGHVFGGKHTNSISDPLGGAAFYGERPDLNPNPRRVNVGPGWDASNRDAMGWIPANRKTTVASGTQTITLTRLTQPGPNGMMLVDVPIGSTGERYVVSARTRVGYDSQQTSNNTLQFGYLLRTPGVVIEKVSPSADTTTVWSNPAGNRESPDAIWSTGQTYTDPTGIRITIDRFDDTGAQVTITNGGGAPPATTVAPTTVPPTAAPTVPPTVPPTTAAPVVTTTPATNAPVAETTVPATAAPTVPPTAPPTTAAPAPPTPTGGRPTDTFAGLPLLAVPTSVPAFSTAGFGVDGGENTSCSGIGATVWFKVTAPASGTLTVTTAGSDYDTVFSVYSGPPAATSFGELGYFGCVDDAPGTSQAEFTGPVTPGSTIYVQVGGYAGASGNLVIAVR